MKARHLEAVLTNQLRKLAAIETKLELAKEVITSLGDVLDEQSVEILADEIGPALQGGVDALPVSVNTAYLKALISNRANSREASAAWERFFTLSGKRNPLHLLAHAQALIQEQRFEEAARQLRFALMQRIPYAFFARAEKVVEEITGQNLPSVRQARVAVLSSGTTSLLIPVLRALCLRDKIQATFYAGLYGAIAEEILDPQSGLAAFHPDSVFLVQHWRDLALPVLSSDEKATAKSVVETQRALWQRLSQQYGCHIVQHLYDFPNDDPCGQLAGSRSRVISQINTFMLEAATSYVSFLDTAAVQRRNGERWENPMLWHSFRQHPSTEALPDLAEAQLAHLRATLGLTRKVFVTDLDNTLWRGVIAEDGLNGIEVGPGTAVGEAHQRLQQYLLDLKNRGILLAVCSKNNPEDARLPFEMHKHMTLRLHDFAVFLANWQDKAQNLREIAQRLSLGLDSFVFLDDDAMEREWVRSQLPEVAVVNLGPSIFEWVRELDRGYYFYSHAVSSEDLARSEQIASESKRELIRTASGSIDEFLRDLSLEASVAPVSENNLARVTQLINKTNQFNLTTRRYTAAQVLQISSSQDSWTGAFELQDRLGHYGLVGVILCKCSPNPGEWEIDTWLISCRAIGRQLECFMFDRMMETALSRGVKRIKGIFKPTKKNSLVSSLFPRLGFRKIHEASEETIYEMDVPTPVETTAMHIRNISALPAESNSPEQAVLI